MFGNLFLKGWKVIGKTKDVRGQFTPKYTVEVEGNNHWLCWFYFLRFGPNIFITPSWIITCNIIFLLTLFCRIFVGISFMHVPGCSNTDVKGNQVSFAEEHKFINFNNNFHFMSFLFSFWVMLQWMNEFIKFTAKPNTRD